MVQIKVSSFEEDLPQSQYSPAEYTIATAREKARSVAAEVSDAKLVIAADTVRVMYSLFCPMHTVIHLIWLPVCTQLSPMVATACS